MARPRIFISSTFYDLRYIRNDLELFIRNIGYEPILNERGSIPYGTKEKLEEYAYQEVERSDIVVAIIGGRYGAQSSYGDYSISNSELKRAVAREKQVYCFIESSVRAEYATYRLNKDRPETKYQHVDDVRIFSFIEEIDKLPRNNTISSFETSSDITHFLREQWAGLFQRFLDEQRLTVTTRAAEDLGATADTLRRLVQHLASGDEGRTDGVISRSIVYENHPIFSRLKRLLNIPYRVFFTSRSELNSWLTTAADFAHEVPPNARDNEEVREWIRGRLDSDEEYELLKIADRVFDADGSLKSFSADEWSDGWVELERRIGTGLPEDPVVEHDG